jgi:hypothetical protein
LRFINNGATRFPRIGSYKIKGFVISASFIDNFIRNRN